MNSKLLFRVFIPVMGLLAGMQFWIFTDSIFLGVGIGLAVAGFLGWFFSSLTRKPKVRSRFIGEVSETIDEEDFIDVVETTNRRPAERVQEKVTERPQQVANSIRSMLMKDRSPR
tara:strand:- start:277 stop:621 length:345 start_codon:yes stop_codon:yes gene_type:complete